MIHRITRLCVYVQENLREHTDRDSTKTKPQEGGLCVLSHTHNSNNLLVSCCFVGSQSNVIIYNKTNTLTSHLTSRFGWFYE